ncbi:hypothetical protein SISSUDRAFT_490059 [Sistotremastrum suecicum HHB10207 ss-3]|uniref:Uncharacterized protein n=1 Tax=Sistotremastrum suecicum HHB10207 ss-3 TaxID=1314776 RepID=A0A165XZS2_9AGAM|nr:hypothetical protein SISSUDRAFT_490059 [Sistotremastrum suecicum HHB10207 ss-3]
MRMNSCHRMSSRFSIHHFSQVQPPNRRPQTAQKPTIHRCHQTLHQTSISTRLSPPSPSSPSPPSPTPALQALRFESSLKPARYHQTADPSQNPESRITKTQAN